MAAPRPRKLKKPETRRKQPAGQREAARAPSEAPRQPARGWPGQQALLALAARVPFLARRRPQFSREDVLAARPFRNPLIAWELRRPEGGPEELPAEAVLRIPRRQDRIGRMLNRFFEGPGHREVVLDEVGTDVWNMCDGDASVEAIIRGLSNKYKLERREVEVSLTTYLQTLAKRGFIGLRVGGDEKAE